MCYPGAGVPATLHSLISGIQDSAPNQYEKWGYMGIICDGLTVAGCDTVTAGEKIKVSLCCCDVHNEHINATILTPADCHTCSYRLTFEWERHVDNPSADLDDFCSCPEPDEYGAVQQIIPTCETAGPPIDCSATYLDLTFESGTCPTGNPSPDTPFLLHYELRTTVNDKRGWWNCDCCQNGIGASDNDVVIEVTIVEGAGTDGACS